MNNIIIIKYNNFLYFTLLLSLLYTFALCTLLILNKTAYYGDKSIKTQFILDTTIYTLFYISTFTIDSDFYIFFAIPILITSLKKSSNDLAELLKFVAILFIIFASMVTIATINMNEVNSIDSLLTHFAPRSLFLFIFFSLSRIIQNIKTHTEDAISESIKFSNEKNAIIDSIGEGIFAINKRHEIMWANKKMINEYEIKNDIDLKKNKCFNTFRKREKICDNCVSILAMNDGQTHETVEEWDNIIYHVTAAPIKTNSNEVIGAVETLLDITAEEKLKTFLNDKNNLLKIIKCAIDCIIVTTNSGKIILSNVGASKLLGYSEDELKRLKAKDIYTTKDGKSGYEIAKDIREKIEDDPNGIIFNYDTYFKTKNKKIIPISLSASKVYDNKNVAGYVGIGRDMTELQKKDRKKILDLINRFIAHNISVRIRKLYNYITMQNEKIKTDEHNKINLKNGLSAIEEINKDLDKLLRATTYTAINKRIINAKEIVENIEKKKPAIILSDNVELSTNISDNNAKIKADIDGITTLLETMINNSIEANAKTIKLLFYSDNTFLNIEFIDDGHGIKKDIEDTLFDLFYTTKSDNSKTNISISSHIGIGLFGVKRIANEHQGEVFLDKSYRKGAKFFIKLPKYYDN